MGPIGMPELLVVLVIVLIIFGAGKISEIGGALGKGISEFRNASSATPANDAASKDEGSTAAGA
jgi:sec-independent protein translocase protein TatA